MNNLENLGSRICIIGNSAAGKSTLAQALGRKLGLAICHLDQIAHLPHTDWQPRDKELMRIDHQNFLDHHDCWVIEGNYSYLMPERFARATVILWLDFSRWDSVYRYTKRSLENNKNRAGNLEGATTQFSFKMIRHILFHIPKNKTKYQQLIDNSGVPCIRMTSFASLRNYYKQWGL